jgi:hypothetical protein
MGQLILSCAKTARSFKSGFQASRDDLRHVPPKWMAQMMCGVCHRIHEFNLAEARVCECPDDRCRLYADCHNCEFALRIATAPREAGAGMTREGFCGLP